MAYPEYIRDSFNQGGHDYRIDEYIAQGGQALVFGATDIRNGSEVALKIFSSVNLPADTAAFRTEYDRLRVLNGSPNIITIYGTGVHQDGATKSPFMVMERAQGSVADVARRYSPGRIPAEQTIRYIAGAMTGMAAAHKRTILHGDLKPANLLLVNDNVKVGDFGVSIDRSGETHTLTHDIQGTEPYMAKEHWEGKLRKQSDVYAMGVVAYQLLTGSLPRQPSTPGPHNAIEWYHAHQREAVRKFKNVGARPEGAALAVEEAVSRALLVDYHERYEDMAAFKTDFVEAAADYERSRRRARTIIPGTPATPDRGRNPSGLPPTKLQLTFDTPAPPPSSAMKENKDPVPPPKPATRLLTDPDAASPRQAGGRLAPPRPSFAPEPPARPSRPAPAAGTPRPAWPGPPVQEDWAKDLDIPEPKSKARPTARPPKEPAAKDTEAHEGEPATNTTSRRSFLKVAGGLGLLAAVGGGGAAAYVNREPILNYLEEKLGPDPQERIAARLNIAKSIFRKVEDPYIRYQIARAIGADNPQIAIDLLPDIGEPTSQAVVWSSLARAATDQVIQAVSGYLSQGQFNAAGNAAMGLASMVSDGSPGYEAAGATVLDVQATLRKPEVRYANIATLLDIVMHQSVDLPPDDKYSSAELGQRLVEYGSDPKYSYEFTQLVGAVSPPNVYKAYTAIDGLTTFMRDHKLDHGSDVWWAAREVTLQVAPLIPDRALEVVRKEAAADDWGWAARVAAAAAPDQAESVRQLAQNSHDGMLMVAGSLVEYSPTYVESTASSYAEGSAAKAILMALANPTDPTYVEHGLAAIGTGEDAKVKKDIGTTIFDKYMATLVVEALMANTKYWELHKQPAQQ